MGVPGNVNPLLLVQAAAAGGYTIDRSLRFNSADSAYLNRTPASAGNRKTWTWAGWVKRSALGLDQTIFRANNSSIARETIIYFTTSNTIGFYEYSSGFPAFLQTTQVFRDTSAWYHIVAVWDTDNATSGNRMRLYVNGVEVTALATDTQPSLGLESTINTATVHTLGAADASNNLFNGYLADVIFVDGQALDPTSFGEFDTNGVWQPIEYTGSYGTNGFHLDFADNSSAAALGYDAAGSNDWTVNNLSVTAGAGNDSLRDSPTNGDTANDTGLGNQVPGNYCTWNPLDRSSNISLVNGNLDSSTATSAWSMVRGTLGNTTGKWYFEYTMSNVGWTEIGIGPSTSPLDTTSPGGSTSYIINSTNGYKGNSGNYVPYGSSFTTGDIIGIAYDLDNGKVWWAKNGTWVSSGDPAAGTNAGFTGIASAIYFPILAQHAGGGTVSGSLNAGQRPFAYTAPSGFKALCTTNLPTPTIADGSTAMDVKLWTGNGSSQSISGLGFSPDLVWIKQRSSDRDHCLCDIVRGTSKRLRSNTTDAETTESVVTAFNSTGFTIGSDNGVNQSSGTYVAWTWDAGSSTVTNNSGSISSQVRANASAGFSVAEFTNPSSGGWTFGHGLNAAPKFVIMRPKSVASNWQVYHIGLSAISSGRSFIWLNSTNAEMGSSNTYWTSDPSSTIVSAGSGMNPGSAQSHIAYCFAPVAGYSAFGSYTGNGSSDGPFVYTGFRPRWVLIKNSSSAANWMLYDTARNTYNTSPYVLSPNTSDGGLAYDAYGGAYPIDILSNGFKPRDSLSNINGSTNTLIFAAFAESPFAYSRAR